MSQFYFNCVCLRPVIHTVAQQEPPNPHHHRRCSTAFTATLMKMEDEERHGYLKAQGQEGGQSGNFKTSNLRDILEMLHSKQNFPNLIHSKNRNYKAGWNKRGSSQQAGSNLYTFCLLSDLHPFLAKGTIRRLPCKGTRLHQYFGCLWQCNGDY